MFSARPDCASPDDAAEPRSPCVGVCRLDREGARCVACLRSIDEIAGWTGFTQNEKRAVLEALVERRNSQAEKDRPFSP
jgi:predicted Fe-S protein YdhL (DUF1289 family)